MNETIRALIEPLLKEGLLRAGLISLLFGTVALAIPDGWLLVNDKLAASLALLGACAILASALTHKKLWTALGDACKKHMLRRAFLKLSNKARLLLLRQATDSSEQVNVIASDATVQELISHQFYFLAPGYIGMHKSRASIFSEKYRWLMSDLLFAKRHVTKRPGEEKDLNAMLESARPGPNSWMR